MIYVIEVPHLGSPVVWTADTRQDLINKVSQAANMLSEEPLSVLSVVEAEERLKDLEIRHKSEDSSLKEAIVEARKAKDSYVYKKFNTDSWHVYLQEELEDVNYDSCKEFLSYDVQTCYVCETIRELQVALLTMRDRSTSCFVQVRKQLENLGILQDLQGASAV